MRWGLMTDTPLILWVRRDLRLADNPMLGDAVASGRAIVPVFILDAETESLGAAAKWRLGLGVAAFAKALEGIGSRLILRRGPALEVLRGLVAEVGAGAVHWARLYDPEAKARDTGVKAALRAQGIEAVSHAGHLLFEPWTVATGQGGFYKVYSPFWRAVKGLDVAFPQPASMPREIGKVMKLNSGNVYYKDTSDLRGAKHWNSLQEKQGISIGEGLMEVKSGQANTCQKCI